MHDWTLVSVAFDWAEARATIHLRSGLPAGVRTLVATNVVDVNIPKKNDWGPSVSVNQAVELDMPDGLKKLQIEMQSGDVVEIIAQQFSLY